MRKGKKYFYFYFEYLALFNLLSKRQQNKLLTALCNYVNTGDMPMKLPVKTNAVFLKIKTIIDFDKLQDDIRIKRQEYGKSGASKRWNNGKLKQNNGKKIAKTDIKKVEE